MYIKCKFFRYSTQGEINIDNPYLFQKVVKDINSWLSTKTNRQVVDVCFMPSKKTLEQESSIAVFYKNLNSSHEFKETKDNSKSITDTPKSESENTLNKNVRQAIKQSQQLIKQSRQNCKQLRAVVEQSKVVRKQSRQLLGKT